jgi:hypothetical protein
MYNTSMNEQNIVFCSNNVRGSAGSKFHTMTAQDWPAVDCTSCTFWAASVPAGVVAGLVQDQSLLVLMVVLVSLP